MGQLKAKMGHPPAQVAEVPPPPHIPVFALGPTTQEAGSPPTRSPSTYRHLPPVSRRHSLSQGPHPLGPTPALS